MENIQGKVLKDCSNMNLVMKRAVIEIHEIFFDENSEEKKCNIQKTKRKLSKGKENRCPKLYETPVRTANNTYRDVVKLVECSSPVLKVFSSRIR